jgi:hypothetical protein
MAVSVSLPARSESSWEVLSGHEKSPHMLFRETPAIHPADLARNVCMPLDGKHRVPACVQGQNMWQDVELCRLVLYANQQRVNNAAITACNASSTAVAAAAVAGCMIAKPAADSRPAGCSKRTISEHKFEDAELLAAAVCRVHVRANQRGSAGRSVCSQPLAPLLPLHTALIYCAATITKQNNSAALTHYFPSGCCCCCLQGLTNDFLAAHGNSCNLQ